MEISRAGNNEIIGLKGEIADTKARFIQYEGWEVKMNGELVLGSRMELSQAMSVIKAMDIAAQAA